MDNKIMIIMLCTLYAYAYSIGRFECIQYAYHAGITYMIEMIYYVYCTGIIKVLSHPHILKVLRHALKLSHKRRKGRKSLC